MNLPNRSPCSLFSLALVSTCALADPAPTVIGCNTGPKAAATPAELHLQVHVQPAAEGCPLLEDKELRKLVDKFAPQTTFAYPLIDQSYGLRTCFTGVVTDGSLTLNYSEGNRPKLTITEGRTESAQRLFPVPGGSNVYAASTDGGQTGFSPPSLQAGAAMTAVDLVVTGEDGKEQALNLLIDDHFLVIPTESAVTDTEDFNIVGSAGRLVSGRLRADGIITGAGPTFELTVDGTICLY